MDLQEFLDIYEPLTVAKYGDNILVMSDNGGLPFVILIKINQNTYITLTNYFDQGIASREFYIDDGPCRQTILEGPNRQVEVICATAIFWAVQVKSALRLTDDYYYITTNETHHPFLKSIYDQYFEDINKAIIVTTEVLLGYPNYLQNVDI